MSLLDVVIIGVVTVVVVVVVVVTGVTMLGAVSRVASGRLRKPAETTNAKQNKRNAEVVVMIVAGRTCIEGCLDLFPSSPGYYFTQPQKRQVE